MMGDYDGYAKAELGDKRLGDRFKTILEQLSGNPAASISAACKDPYQSKAAYRFLSNPKVSAEAVIETARDVTIGNINEAKPRVVLDVQDTTEFNYSNLKATEGLGNIGRKRTSYGVAAHSAIAVGEVGDIYGMLGQKTWARPPEEQGKSKNRKKLPIEEKESYKWLETLKNTEGSYPEGTLVVHVSDREGDVYEYFCEAGRLGANYLTRRSYVRKVEGEGGDMFLDDFVEALPVAGEITVRVPRDSHTGRIERNAQLEVKHGKTTLIKPTQLVSTHDIPKTIEAYVVSAVETDPPTGQEGISWQLITNVPTTSFEDALTRIQWYTQRWKIELFHRTLKSGCKVEELQSDSADKLMKLLAIYSIIALHIMLISYVARTRPDESCEICLTGEEWKILYRAAKKTKEVPEKPPTIYEAVIMIAKLGGFLARASDGFPGVAVVWRGLTAFYAILEVAPFLA